MRMPESNKKHQPKAISLILPMALAALAVIAIWFGTPCLVEAWSSSSCLANRGQFGDQFGATNTLFTALAFILLVLNAVYQKQQLAIQKKEYDETAQALRDEHDRQMQMDSMRQKAFKIEVLRLKFALEKDLLDYLTSPSTIPNQKSIEVTRRNLDELEGKINKIYAEEITSAEPKDA